MKIKTLDDALFYTQAMISRGAESDGCTFAMDLGIKRFCVMHDMLRRFKPVSALQADKFLYEGIMTKGWRYWPIAVSYYLAVRISWHFGFYKN